MLRDVLTSQSEHQFLCEISLYQNKYKPVYKRVTFVSMQGFDAIIKISFVTYVA